MRVRKSLIFILCLVVLPSCGLKSSPANLSAHSSQNEVLNQNFPPPNPVPNPQKRLFGYYASAYDGLGLGADYLDEMPGRANVVYIKTQDPAGKLAATREAGLKAILEFSDSIVTDETGRLLPDWQSRLTALFAVTDRYQDALVALYMLDEPYGYGQAHGLSDAETFSELELVGSFVKAHYPNLPIATILSSSEILRQVPLPSSIDWFGVDCYDSFDQCHGHSVPELYQMLDSRIRDMDQQDHRRRQLMVIPPSAYTAVGVLTEANSLHQLQEYRDWLKYRSDIRIVLGFLWQSFKDGETQWVGTRDSKALRTGYKKFYEDFIQSTDSSL